MTPLLEVRNLSKSFENVGGAVALRDVSFKVARGEFLVVIGLSGSGKSTLLRCLNHLTPPDSGQITFLGERTDARSPRGLRARRRKMAMIFQHFNLVPRASALDNVLTGRLAQRGWWQSLFNIHPRAEVAEAARLLRSVGLGAQVDQRADRLSGGQRQRVAIARALHQDPVLILADEPVASLDPATSRGVMDLLKRAARERGIAVICNLHHLSLVRAFADRVIALRAGELVFEGSPHDIDPDWFRRIYGEDAREITGD